MSQPQIVEQNSKRLLADHSLPDMLVTVQLRSACGLGVVAVPDLHVIQADCGIKMLQGLIEAGLAHNVISGYMRMTGIDAGSDWNHSTQSIQNLRDLLETSSQRELRAGGILDENREPACGQVEPLR